MSASGLYVAREGLDCLFSTTFENPSRLLIVLHLLQPLHCIPDLTTLTIPHSEVSLVEDRDMSGPRVVAPEAVRANKPEGEFDISRPDLGQREGMIGRR